MEPWIDRPMDESQLEELRQRLARMGTAELQHFYQSAHHMSRMDRREAPRAAFVQQLVQAWRELDRRRKLAKSA
jgi:hypothetical protein